VSNSRIILEDGSVVPEWSGTVRYTSLPTRKGGQSSCGWAPTLGHTVVSTVSASSIRRAPYLELSSMSALSPPPKADHLRYDDAATSARSDSR